MKRAKGWSASIDGECSLAMRHSTLVIHSRSVWTIEPAIYNCVAPKRGELDWSRWLLSSFQSIKSFNANTHKERFVTIKTGRGIQKERELVASDMDECTFFDIQIHHRIRIDFLWHSIQDSRVANRLQSMTAAASDASAELISLQGTTNSRPLKTLAQEENRRWGNEPCATVSDAFRRNGLYSHSLTSSIYYFYREMI